MALFSSLIPVSCSAEPAVKKIRLGNTVINAEVVNTDASRARGLMYRERLEPGTGMLFVFPVEGHYSFWMKNMRFPLDMLWISSSGTITDIMAQVPPCGEGDCPGLEPVSDALYVLEVEAGFCAGHAIKAGDRLEIQ